MAIVYINSRNEFEKKLRKFKKMCLTEAIRDGCISRSHFIPNNKKHRKKLAEKKTEVYDDE